MISIDSQSFTLILLGGFELAYDNGVNEIFWSCNSKDMKKLTIYLKFKSENS